MPDIIISLRESIITIGRNSFTGCRGISTITIPATVTSIGEGFLQDCSSLTNICLDASNTAYTIIDGILYDKELALVLACPVDKMKVNLPESL